ncbi:propionate catabolism operon regulatory protein PrpR [Pseudomonas monteilii]|uniref:propionate catabolism operon regulatory protein PrpR n=1 Tax=Pseudomonas monteilii TaxID=76759 RepID=UPI003CFFAD0F
MIDSRRPPQIVVLISHLEQPKQMSRLSEMVATVAPFYSSSAEIRAIDTTVETALKTAKDYERLNSADVFICSGATADYLRRHLNRPVLSIRTGGGDLLRALDAAREHGTKVALLSNRHTNADLASMQSLFTIEIHQASYNTLEQARQAVVEVKSLGYRTVIGSSTVVELAEQEGLTGILSLSVDTIRKALDDALGVLQSSRIEIAKRRHLDGVLQHIPSGVAALDTDGLLLSVNPALSTIIGRNNEELVGLSLNQLCPELELSEALNPHKRTENQLVRIGEKTVIYSLLPTVENGDQTGYVFTCQETSTVLQADKHIRSALRTGGFPARYRLEQFLGSSSASTQLAELAKRYASTDSTVLITGESGTGKELLAQGIHNHGHRHNGPFVAINCASFAESLLESELFGYHEGAFTGSRKGGKPGLIELAHGGTLFLDEIGDMPISLQPRLLRVLQEREVLRLGGTEPTAIDIRVIAATHQDLSGSIEGGTFRKDLYYRLNILRLETVPLRERKADIIPIARSIMRKQLAAIHRLELADVLLEMLLKHLMTYDWPGNIRELENIIERAVFSSEQLLDLDMSSRYITQIIPEFKEHLTSQQPIPEPSSAGQLKSVSKLQEKQYIEEVIKACEGDLNKAAQQLGISRTTLWRRLNKA